jgi:DNA recombination protein RmuC
MQCWPRNPSGDFVLYWFVNKEQECACDWLSQKRHLMTTILLSILIALVALAVIFQIVLLFRPTRIDFTQALKSVEDAYQRVERSVREEIVTNRQEGTKDARESREELSKSLKAVGDSLNQQIATLTQSNDQKLDQIRLDSSSAAQQTREAVTLALKSFGESTATTLDALKKAVEEKLKAIQDDNTRKLEQMRATVDEKLQGTLEKRLGESFRLVSERLEQVHQGLGEMQALASGVGDLKKVLTNVKTRGTWGEVQLGAMLEQILAPDQYALNVATKDAGERVEFAIKLPGRGADKADQVWLPIDAKFPVEDYQRLMDAQEKADPQAAEQATKQLELRIKQCARDICDKYIGPPRTTDFGILFLPTEGLFAEVIRCTGLAEYVQRECRVVIAGPTTLWSILSSLQMGFRTLAIEKHSSEVWKVLGAVKTEFGKFGELLDGVKRKLDQASTNIEDAARKSRAIERKLQAVQELPVTEADALRLVAGEPEGNSEGPS